MKKLLLSALAVSTGLFATAQVNSNLTPTLQTSPEGINMSSQRSARASNYNDTIWHDGFDNTNAWTKAGGPSNQGWQISNVNGTNQGTWYFANTRITSSGGGNYAVLVPDDPNTAGFSSSTFTTSSAIDISAYSSQNLVLSYELYGARFIDTLRVEVSNNNSTWTQVDFSDFPINSTQSSFILPNPTSREMFLPSSIVNGDSLYIRFNWDANNAQPGIGYGFFVDDVLLSDVYDNDLVLDGTAFFDDVRILYSWYFGDMPRRQAEADDFTFSATYYNRGKNAALNSGLELIVSGQDNATITSATQNVAAGALGDTARTTVIYNPTAGVGTYTFTWNIFSDSTDVTPANNMKSIDLNVTENEYSMAPLPVSGAGALGKGGSGTSAYTLTQDYYMMTDDTIVGIGVAFDSEWTKAGGAFQLSLLDANGVLGQTGFITVTPDMITDDMVYFPFSTPANVAVGTYEARIETFTATDSIFLVSCVDPESPIEPAPGGGFFSRTTLSYGGSNFIEDMVYMSLKNNGSYTCGNATVTGTVGSGTITVDNVTGLVPMYVYSWVGPNGFTSSDRDLTGLVDPGNYTLTVSDINGCTAIETFTISCITGTVTANVDATSITNVAVTNLTAPYTYAWSGPNGFTSTSQDITGLENGDYTVTITDANSCTAEETFTVACVPMTVTATQPSNNTAEATVTGGTGPFTYQWNTGETTQTITNLTVGSTYTVTVTDVAACSEVSSINIVSSIVELGVNGSIKVYPNPNNGNFMVALEGVDAGAYQLAVINVTGQELETRNINVTGNEVINFNSLNLNQGVYFVKLTNNREESSILRVIVK